MKNIKQIPDETLNQFRIDLVLLRAVLCYGLCTLSRGKGR